MSVGLSVGSGIGGTDLELSDGDRLAAKANGLTQTLSNAGNLFGKEYITTFKNKGMAKIFDQIKTPVRCVNADLWPTDKIANRRHMRSFDVSIIEDVGHFLMLENPRIFNSALKRFVKEIVKKSK